jgi:CheY-like chemotaxis protein
MDQSPHILFVEDDADIRTLVAGFLTQKNGYWSCVAREGRELDRIVEVSRIDLMILDIMLPKEDGLSVCRRIRAVSDVPIIKLTARGSEVPPSKHLFCVTDCVEHRVRHCAQHSTARLSGRTGKMGRVFGSVSRAFGL